MRRRGLHSLLCLLTVAATLAVAGQADAAGPKKLFGVVGFGNPTASEFQRLARGGVRTVRINAYWGSVEPSPGVRDWTAMDAVVSDAAAAGIELHPFLFSTPPWASSNPAGPPSVSPPLQSSQARAGWAAFVRDLAGRYGTTGSFWLAHPSLPRLPIRYWQLWNEVNLSYYWGSQPSAAGYADLLRLTVPALREGDPSAKLVSAGLIPFKSAAAGTVSGDRYLQRLYAIRGMRKLIDVVAIHPYGKRPGVVLKFLRQMRGVLNAVGAKRTPIWATEFGWATGGVDWASSPLRATSAQQARWVAQTYAMMRSQAKRLRLKRAFYFSDNDFGGIQSWIGQMGLFDTQGQPKPSWLAYARAAGGQP